MDIGDIYIYNKKLVEKYLLGKISFEKMWSKYKEIPCYENRNYAIAC